MCCCGFKALEFWLLWLSITAAGFISSNVFDIQSLRFTTEDGEEASISETDPELKTESDLELFFLGVAIAEAFFFLLLVMLVLHCCPSKKRIARRGRKVYMVRLVQWIMLFVLVGTVVGVAATDKMKFKQGDEFYVGRVLLGCEFVCIVVELLILRKALHATNKLGVFAKTFAEAMVSAMVAAQLVIVQQKEFLFAAMVMTFMYALCMTRVNEPSKFENYTAILGFAGGLGLAVAFEGTHKFRTEQEIVSYMFLFAFNFAIPMVKSKYEHVAIDPAYEFSYRRDEHPAESLV